jgi:hypothetical protein
MKKKPIVISSLLAASAAVAVAVPVAEGTTAKRVGTSQRAAAADAHGVPGLGGPPGGPPGPAAVHSVSVVPNKAHSAFITLTTDRGKIQSVDGTAGTITLVEGTKSLKYQTVTLRIPANATVILDGKSSSLAQLAAEDEVSVMSSSEGTSVLAADPSFHPEGTPGSGGPPPVGYPAPASE